MRRLIKIFYLLAFIEGACVMVCELLGAKMIAPFFGSSLYVWAAVLGVTLTALMGGYFIGGIISDKVKSDSVLFWVLLFAGALLAVMPYLGYWVMMQLIDFSVQAGTTLSLFTFMFPPLLLMGMSSPIIIGRINDSVEHAGKSAGSIYAISTLGGITATFMVGFWLLPDFGIKIPALFFGALLALPSAAFLVLRKRFYAGLILVPLLGAGFLAGRSTVQSNSWYKIIYESEGILGQVRVVDMPYYSEKRGWKNGRALIVNNTIQTIANRDDLKFDLWDGSIYFPAAVSNYAPGSDALLLGLGGGTIVHQFERLGFDIDAVEIDARIRDVAQEFFEVSPDLNIVIDDARRYINTCVKKYDIITLDLFLNETPPSHVLTKECFERLKTLLNPGGIVMMNFFGYLSGEQGRAARCIIRTFRDAGFELEILATPGEEKNRNLIFLAHPDPLSFDDIAYGEKDLDSIFSVTPQFIDLNQIDLSDAHVLSDEIPSLEKIYLPAALEWRRTSIDYVLKPLNQVEL